MIRIGDLGYDGQEVCVRKPLEQVSNKLGHVEAIFERQSDELNNVHLAASKYFGRRHSYLV